MESGLLLASDVQNDRLDGMDHGLAALPEREQPNTECTEEKPHDSHDHPACLQIRG